VRVTRYDEALAAGRHALGSCCALDGFGASHLLAAAGLDVLMIDTQHGLYDWAALETMCWRVRATGALVVVRPGSHDRTELLRMLELPADGLLFPDVDSLAQAEAIVHNVLLPPRGRRPVAGARLDTTVYPSGRPTEMRIGLQIEHIDAVGAIEAIAGLPGVAFLMVGQLDLAASMGIDAQAVLRGQAPPEHAAAIARVRQAARSAGVPCWSWAPTAQAAQRDLDDGVDVVLWSVDTAMLRDAVTAFLGAVDATRRV
jgi:2-keto-3-deoxy-L-rhamnonate aldolase RhmA